MNLTASLKKAPRWAWYTAGGLALGAGAIKVYKNREGSDTVENTPAADVGTTTTVGSGSPPGVIVPPVILGGNSADPEAGVGALSSLYLDATSNLFGAWESLLGPVMDTQNQLLLGNADTISQIAMAGGAPQSAPTPVISVLPLPQFAPQVLTPKPAGAAIQPRVVYENRTRDNGKSGKQRVVWCNKVKIHVYPDGHRVVVSEDKIHDGAC